MLGLIVFLFLIKSPGREDKAISAGLYSSQASFIYEERGCLAMFWEAEQPARAVRKSGRSTSPRIVELRR